MEYVDAEAERDIEDAMSCDGEAAEEPPAEERENTDDQDMDERILDLPDKTLAAIAKIMDKHKVTSFGALYKADQDRVRKMVHKDDDRQRKEDKKERERAKKSKSHKAAPLKRRYENAFGEGGEGGEGEEGEGKKDKALRPETRKLLSLPQIGLGTCEVSTKLRGVAGNHRRVFFKREDLVLRGGATQVDDGPFGDKHALAWWLCLERQRFFAERFSIPVSDELAMRRVESDRGDVALTRDHCSVALFAFLNTHRATHLDIPRTQEIESISLPQFHGDRKSRMVLDAGPEGGTVGVADCVLFKISLCEDTLTVDPEILQVITYLCKALKGGVDEMYAAVATEFTEPMTAANSKGKVQDGGRFFDEYSAEGLKARGARSMADDIDYSLIDRICTYREGVLGAELDMNDDHVIPRENAINSETLRGLKMPCSEEKHEIIIKKGLVDVFLWSHVMDGVDRNGHVRQMRIDLIRLQAKMPGVEPIIFLENASKMEGLCFPLLNVFKHMGMVLRRNQAMTMSMADAFSVGKKAQLSSMCTEAHVPVAVFNFADSEGLTDVHLGGMRMNVRDREEMLEYQEFLKGVEAARNEHYRMISAGVSADMAPSGCMHARKPLATFSTQFYSGVHYRSIPTELLEERVQELLDDVRRTCIENLADATADTACLLATILRSKDGRWCYMDVGGALAWNCGILIKYNPDSFAPYCKPNTRNKAEAAFEFTPQPFKCAPVIEVYMESRGAGNDQFACLWEPGSDITLDLDFLKQNKSRLNAQLTAFVDHVHDIASSATIQGLQQTRMQEEELLSLYGVSENKLHGILAQCKKGAELDSMARIVDSQVRQSVKNALSLMSGGMLLQFEMAALTVRDLKKIEEERSREWIRDSVPMRAVVERRLLTAATDLLNAETHTAFFYRLSDQRLAMDICFMNHTLVDLYNAGMCANFCSDNAWGMPVQLTDGASTWSLIVTLPNGSKAEYIHNKKESGAGADVSSQIKTQNDNAHAKFNSVGAKVTAFGNSVQSLDKSARHVSSLGMATYNGSGVAVGSDGAIRMDNKKDRDEAGLGSYFCELRKLNGDSDHSLNFLQNIENWIAHSGAGAGTNDEGWTTTENLKGIVYKQFFSMPVILLTGNRQEPKVPSSSINGGRMRVVNASVQDGKNGRIYVDRDEAAGDSDESDDETCMRDALVVSADVTDVKYMTEERAHKNKIFCLISMIKRKAFPFTNRVMTLKFLRAHYVLSFDMRTLGNNIRDMSGGLRRAYLRDSTVMNRTWDGPFKLVTLHPTAVTYSAERCIQAALAATYADAKNEPHVPLYAAFEDTILATVGVPISLQCVLSALHLWLFATVLDVSVMIVSMFFLFSTGFRKHCPFNILALAATDQELTPAEELVYEEFARYLLETVTMPAGDPARIAWASPAAKRARGMGLQMSGHFKEATREEVVRWHDWSGDGRFHEIKTEIHKRSHRQVPTGFVTTGADFVVTEPPEWMATAEPGKSSKTRGEAYKFDSFTMGSTENIVATAYASMQTKDGDDARALRHGPLDLRSRTDVFWQAAHVGTRLPQVNRKTMDSNDLTFPPVWTTAVFYNNVRKNTTGVPGVVRHFLALCNMKERCSRADFVKSLLGRYMRKHNVRREFLQNTFWTSPIIGDDEYTCFKWGVMPREAEAGGSIEGVQVSLNVDIVWLVLSQALYAHEWQGQDCDGSESVVHLRSLASCSLSMLSLFVHTQVERSAIPVNSGSIFLNHPNPVVACPLPAALCYDPRLHVDCYLGRNSERLSDNMLSNRLRKPQHFQLLSLEDGTQTMYYKCVIAAAEKGSAPERAGDLFPFPPESVAHMQAHFVLMNTAYKRLCTMDVPEQHKTLQVAFQLYGCSVRSEMVRHIPTSLTQCAVQDAREIPCLTFERGFMFVLKVRGNMVEVVPTQPSSVLLAETLTEHCSPSSALPLAGPTRFAVDKMGAMMTRGLQMRVSGAEVSVSLAARIGAQDSYDVVEAQGTVSYPCEDLPFSLFPVVHWKHLVQVRCRDLILRLPDFPTSLSPFVHTQRSACFGGAEPHVRVVPVKTFFDYAEREKFLRDDAELQAYLAGLAAPPQLLDRACTLRLVRLSYPEHTVECFFVVRRVFGEKHDRYQYYNSLAHLRFHLTATGGKPFDETANAEWPAAHRDLLVAGRCLYNPHDEETVASLALLHRIVSTDQGASFAVLVHEYVEQGDGSVTQELVSRVELGASVEPEWTLGPVDHWHEDGPEALGVVLKHPRSNQFLKNGHYYVECLSPLSATPVRGLVDFVSAARCVVREGRMVFLRLSTARYRELCACVHRSMRKGFELCVLEDPEEPLVPPADEDVDFMELEAYYVLGDDSVASGKRHSVKLVVTVQSLNLMDGSFYYNEESKHKVVFNTRLAGRERAPIVTLYSDDALKRFATLIYKARTPAPPPPLPPVAQREIWAR